MRLFLFFLFFSFGQLDAKPTRSLAEASSRIMRHFQTGLVVTAENLGKGTSFAATGALPTTDLPPEDWSFDLGSLTEIFNGLLLAIAVEESRVSLDTTLAQLLEPERPFSSSTIGRITLRQLVTHRSGLPDLPTSTSSHWLEAEPDMLAAENPFWETLNTSQVRFPDRYRHSRFGHAVLGAAIANVYGQSWESLVEQKILRPLGLSQTSVSSDAKASRALLPAQGLRSTARDLASLAQAFIHPSSTPIEEALKRSLQHETSSFPHTALGWQIDTFYDEPSFERQGQSTHGSTAIQLLPQSSSFRIILGTQPQLLSERIFNALVQRPAPPLASPNRYDANFLKAYTGHYHLGDGEAFEVILARQQLWLKRRSGSFHPLFIHERPDRFFLKNEPLQVQFERHDQRVTLFTLESLGRRRVAHKPPEDRRQSFTLGSAQLLQDLAGVYRTATGDVLEVVAAPNHLVVKNGQSLSHHFYPLDQQARSFANDDRDSMLIFSVVEVGESKRFEWRQKDATILASEWKTTP